MGPAESIMPPSSKSFVVPKLARDGANWVTWKSQMLVTLSSTRGAKRHLDGTARIPPPIPTYPDGHVLTAEEEEALDELEKRWDDYNQREAIIKAQIFTTIPDSLLIEIRNLKTAKETWDVVCAKHETRALTIKVDVRCRMYEMKCEDESNVRTHLESLMSMQEQLAGMNGAFTNDDLVTIILGLLPKSYRPLINAITMSAAHSKATLEPDQIVSTLVDKFERLAIKERQLKASENALAATKGRGKPQACSSTSGATKNDMECWKCGKKGHMKVDCRSKAKKKGKTDEDKKGGETANVAAEGEGFTFTTTFAGPTLALGTSPLMGREVDVYDSGVSGHMSLN
jgi:gag-polypeptide of LTR copia-type/Zinc knuckle